LVLAPSTSRSSGSARPTTAVLAVQPRRQPKHGSPDFARDIAMQKIAARLEGAQLAREASASARPVGV